MLRESRLEGMRVYLSGPMQYAKDGGRFWRNDITPKLEELGLIVLDPTNKQTRLSFCNNIKDEYQKQTELLEKGDFDTLTKYVKEVVHLDLRCVDVSDCVISFYDINVNTCGTIDEIITARIQKKPVYLVCAQGKNKVPLWLFGRIPHKYMLNSFDEVIDKLKTIAYCDDKDLDGYIDKNWLFI